MASHYRIGNGYFGSPQILTSQGNDELIQQHKLDPAHTVPLSAYKFSFVPKLKSTEAILYIYCRE